MRASHRLFIAILTAGPVLPSSLPAHSDDLIEEQVLVTANRVPEEALRLPLAWSTVDSDALALIDPIHINEVMQRVPGAWISRGNGQESLISLRSPVLTGPGSCGAFYTAADGISLRAPGFCNVNQLFDANFEQARRIEVIKGPATALYGSNAMHGVINILSAAPSEQLDHSLALEAGPYDYYRAKYRYSDTVGAHGISLSANGSSDGGYKDDSGYDQQKMTLRYDYAGQQWDINSVLDLANLNQDTAGFIRGYKSYKDSDLKKTNPNPDAYRDAWSVRLYSSASRALNESNTLTITPYLRDNDMEFLQHFLPWQSEEKNKHSSLGLRTTVHTDAGALRWVNGIDLEYTDGSLKETQEEPFSPNQPAGVHYDYQVDATVAAAYSQLRTQTDSPWEFSAGARLEYTNYDYDNQTEDGPACAPDASACRFYRPADREDDFTDWSLNFGSSYSFSPAHIAYLRLARGFRAPQVTELYRLQSGQRSADLDSEKIDNVEVGIRGSWRDSLQYDVAVYYMHKDDVIFQDADRQNVSGSETRHYGTEISLEYHMAENWTLGVDATFASHTYDNRIDLLGAGGDIKGNDIDTAPEAFGSARLGWDFSQLTGQNSRAELEWVYMGSYYLEPDNEHKYDGHSLLNLRISSQLGPRWSTNLRVTNLLDEDYAERADFGFGSYRYFVGQPRGLYVEISYQFGVPRA
jgi:outer membrane receptor protein involved in Fe transport